MNDQTSNQLNNLIQSLGTEVVLAQPGSDQGQFPILDLLGNVRDKSAGITEVAELHKLAAESWEKVVLIVEAGRGFTAPEVEWLGELYRQLERMVDGSGTASLADAASAPASEPKPEPAATPAPEAPAAPSATSQDAAATPPSSGGELELILDVGGDEDVLRDFLAESREHIDNIEQGILVLEDNPTDAETLNTVFRAFHTVKGGAGFLNLTPVNRLAHVLESLLDLPRQQRLTLNSAIIEMILQGGDTLRQFMDAIEAQLTGQAPSAPIVIPTAALSAKVRGVIDDVEAGRTPCVVASEPEAEPHPAESGTATSSAQGASAASSAPRATSVASTVKVTTLKLDSLVDLVGELVIAQSQVMSDMDQLLEVRPQSARNLAQMGRIIRELQRVGLSMRMVPIRTAFQKMTRVVRDLAAKQHKHVELVTEGDDTEMDRNLVEALGDPLLHMIRNSVDHGIEKSEVREANGKSSTATIYLRARHQSGNIVVEVEDDGAGLNRERIFAKAVERGIVDANAQLTDAEIHNLLFAPGFSTAESVTDISGRGVGLDVVRRNIEKLRGRVDVDSTPGKGTVFRLMLPLTLAIIDGLIVKVGGERFIIPTLSVCESFRPSSDLITTVQGRGELVNVRGRLVPLIRLHDVFGLEPASRDISDGLVIIVQSGTTMRALLVDTLVNKQEVVIKTLGEFLQQRSPALAGAAILGDGTVGLILDMNALNALQSGGVLQAA